MHGIRGKLSYSNVISTLALVLAAGGGTAYAASAGGAATPAVLKVCAAKKGGDLRLLSGGSCKPNEQALTIDGRGMTGGPGPAGPVGAPGAPGPQGERGPVGVPTSVASPDGRFTIAATNAGIVLTGPKGSLAFDGEELLAGGNLKITTPLNLTVTNGIGLAVITGGATSITTGTNFEQTVGAAYNLVTGGLANESVAGNFTQTVGGAYEQNVAHASTESIGGSYEQTVEGAFKQQVDSTFKAAVGGAAVFSSPTLQIGGESSCALAARVGSEIDNFGRVVEKGSSKTVKIC
jgi:hypothetical protein